MGFSAITVLCCEHQVFNAKAHEAVVGDLRIVPMGNTFVVELTYRSEKEEKDLSKCVSLDSNEALFCDLGLDNFATFVSTKPGVRPFLIKGTLLSESIKSGSRKSTSGSAITRIL